MKKNFTSLLLLLALLYGTQLLGQPAIGIHPMDKEISLRTNKLNKNFWDYRVGLDIGYMEGYGYFKYRMETIWNRRAVNKEQVKFYYGFGLAIQDFMPQFLVPLGIEVFPIQSVENFSFSAEIRPTINFAYFVGTELTSDIAFRYYF